DPQGPHASRTDGLGHSSAPVGGFAETRQRTQQESAMSAIRRAEATWSGNLATGSGAVSAVSSGAFSSLPVSWSARTESSDGLTSPEELVAAAHAACFSMALSAGLGRAGTPPERLDVTAEVTFDKVDAGWKVVSSALTVRGSVPGMSMYDFVAAGGAAQARWT